MDIVKRSRGNRRRTRGLAIDTIKQWYAIAAGSIDKDHVDEKIVRAELCDQEQPDGTRHWWLEPMLPGRNLIVVEKEFGNDAWEIHTEWTTPIIRSHGGL